MPELIYRGCTVRLHTNGAIIWAYSIRAGARLIGRNVQPSHTPGPVFNAACQDIDRYYQRHQRTANTLPA